MRLKTIVKVLISFVLSGIILIFCINYLFGVELNGDKGIFSIIGSTSVSSNFKNIETDNYDTIRGIQNTEYPDVKYVDTVCKTGETLDLMNLILVRPAGSGTYYKGSERIGFTVIIKDIMDDSGTSILTASINDYENTDDIVAPAYYNPSTCEIVFHQSGVYRVSVKVTGKNGRVTYKEVRIPVEV